MSGALETNAFKSVFQEATRKAHTAVFSKDRDQLILTIQDANAVIVGAVRSVNPQIAKKIPDDVGQRLVRVTNSKVALTARAGRTRPDSSGCCCRRSGFCCWPARCGWRPSAAAPSSTA